MKTVHANTMSEYVTMDKAAKDLGASINGLYQWLRKHDVEVVRLGWTILVRMEDLKDYRPQVRA